MSDVRVLAVNGHKEWASEQYGTFKIYDVAFDAGDGERAGQIKRKATSPAPTVGESFEATIVDKSPHPPELKRVQQQGGNGGGGGRSPQDTKQIVRQHSQEMAIRWARELREGGMWPTDATGEQRRTALKALIDWFQTDAEGTA